jgi:lipopolysaccharide cholinephosphotransferase
MLKIFHFLCTRHDIEYFLSGGTMLGAVRHKGFIPWDDDLDVGMTRSNFEKFERFAVPELPRDIFFQTDETDPGYPSFHIMEAKLRDKYSSYSRTKNWHNGLQIDIIVYDRAYLPGNFFIYVLNRALKFSLPGKKNRQRAEILKWIEKHAIIPLVYSCSFIHGFKMVSLGTNYLKAEEIKNLIKIKFEDLESYIPQGWHGYLSRRYGAYMKPPPTHMQKGHHSNSNYMQDENVLKEVESSDGNLPDPFTPCDHKEILYWSRRNVKP